jgi:CheY-like chemotaxis protein
MGESCSSCQIILVEDNPADVGLVRAVLREHRVDCELHVTGDGEEALSFIDSLDLDAQTPVVVFTSSDAPSDHENADRNAALHYFRKPSPLGEFLELGIIIKAVIGRAQAWLTTLRYPSLGIRSTRVQNGPSTPAPASKRQ